MPQDYHKTLEECATKAKDIESEITKFKSAIELNNDVADNAKAVSKALVEIAKQVQPLTEAKFKRFKLVIIAICSINLLATIAILILVIIYR